ncbi:MAG: stage II sporulation protein M [Chloroflexota bacterium]
MAEHAHPTPLLQPAGLRQVISGALVITKRELRDQVRDWRILVPIMLLTVGFPWLMNFTASQAVEFVSKYEAPIIAERLIPFLLMIVGFFPLSVSLVIALESFVGEKERHSIEPLLCSPLSDVQLYFGKLLASMMLPLIASFLGIAVYLFGIAWQVGWRPQPLLLVQMLLLTLVQAVVMVSGAVVVSSQTTSVRAANLLASFIIIPMTFLIQAESIIMFWAIYDVLWWMILALVIIAGLLVRTGVAYFNREEMLGRELDILDLRGSFRLFIRSFTGGARSLPEWYRRQVLTSLKEIRLAILVMALGLLIGVWAGTQISKQFVLPPELLSLDRLDQGFVEGLQEIRFFSPAGVAAIVFQNLRVLALASLLGIFSFGVLSILVMMLPLALISYVGAGISAAGGSWLLFFTALVLPHGILEIPAIVIGGATILSLGATLTAPAQGKTVGEAFVIALARWARLMIGVVIPLFLGAAVLEVFLTPHVAVWLLAR